MITKLNSLDPERLGKEDVSRGFMSLPGKGE